jgi:putative flippase GtrA
MCAQLRKSEFTIKYDTLKRRIAKRSSFLYRYTIVRFGVVGLFSEALFFIIYGIVLSLSRSNTSLALGIAGGICILVNSYAHSRVTFRVRFGYRLLIGYFLIQLVGYATAFALGIALEKVNADSWIIAIVTYSVWTVLSFLLTRSLFLEGKEVRQTSHLD